jgi:hypothetical protein
MMTYEQLKEWLDSRPACCAGGREAAADELARRRLTQQEVDTLSRLAKSASMPDFVTLLRIKERFK